MVIYKNDNKLVANEINKKYGRLRIISISIGILPNGNTASFALCKCNCGVLKMLPLSAIKAGKRKSCGCLRIETLTKHGNRYHPLYDVWMAMIQRCTNPKCYCFKDYGGRGITVCKTWLNSFNKFYTWSIKNGWVKGLDLDRENNNKGYNPKNCRFVSTTINCRNRRSNLYIVHNGETKTLSEWVEYFNIDYHKTRYRLKKGISLSDIIQHGLVIPTPIVQP